MDSGPIIVQAEVPVLEGDTAESLAIRVLAVEHRIYPEALRLLAGGRIRLEGDICRTSAIAASDGSLISPGVR
jgi:phosphoribosylglycinamide formyltransferase-1